MEPVPIIKTEAEAIKSLYQLINLETSTFEDLKPDLQFVTVKSVKYKWPQGCPLIWAVKKNRKDLVKGMIESYRYSVNSISSLSKDGFYDWCPLGAAIGSANEDMAKFLVFEKKASLCLSRNNGSESILCQAIFAGNVWAINFFVETLKEDLNFSRETKPPTLFLAIWRDFQSIESSWPMTKCVLKHGAQIPNFSWVRIEKSLIPVQNPSITYHGAPPTNSNVGFETFFSTLKEVNQGRFTENELETLRVLIQGEGLFRGFSSLSGTQLPCSYRFCLDKFTPRSMPLRSPLVQSVKWGRQDLVKLLVVDYGWDINGVEEATGLNPLGMAAELENMTMMAYLVIELGADVNHAIKYQNSNISGPLLGLAVANRNFELAQFVSKNLGADVNQDLSDNGRQTTILNFCIQNWQKSGTLEMIHLLITSGANLEKTGWFNNGRIWKLTNPIDLAILMVTRYHKEQTCIEVLNLLTAEQCQREQQIIAKESIDDLVVEMSFEMNKFKWQQTQLKQKLDATVARLPKEEMNQMEIESLQANPSYMTETQIQNLKEEFEMKMSNANKMKNLIAGLKAHPSFSNVETSTKKVEVESEIPKSLQQVGACLLCLERLEGRLYVECASKHLFCFICLESLNGCCLKCQQEFGKCSKIELTEKETAGSWCLECKTVSVNISACAGHIKIATENSVDLLKAEKQLTGSSDFLENDEIEILTAKFNNKVKNVRILNTFIKSSIGEKYPDSVRRLWKATTNLEKVALSSTIKAQGMHEPPELRRSRKAENVDDAKGSPESKQIPSFSEMKTPTQESYINSPTTQSVLKCSTQELEQQGQSICDAFANQQTMMSKLEEQESRYSIMSKTLGEVQAELRSLRKDFEMA